MIEKTEFFADQMSRINFSGGMIRMDFVNLPAGSAEEPSAPQDFLRIIMPPNGMLTAFNSMQQLMDKLVETGVFRKKAAAEEEPAKAPRKAKRKTESKA